jgi:tellurite resistance protein TerA
MTWTNAIDFDLAALYETKTGDKGIIYFGDLGNADKPPYIHLSGDKSVNDAAGQHEEIMTISKLDALNSR